MAESEKGVVTVPDDLIKRTEPSSVTAIDLGSAGTGLNGGASSSIKPAVHLPAVAPLHRAVWLIRTMKSFRPGRQFFPHFFVLRSGASEIAGGWQGEQQPLACLPITGRPYRFSFRSSQPVIDALALCFATYSRTNSGTVVVRIKAIDDPHEPPREVSVAASEIRNNEVVTFLFDPFKEAGGRRFSVEIAHHRSLLRDRIALWGRSVASGSVGSVEAGVHCIPAPRIAPPQRAFLKIDGRTKKPHPRFLARCAAEAGRDRLFGWAGNERSRSPKPLTLNAPLAIKFHVPYSGLCSVEVPVATYHSSGSSELRLRLTALDDGALVADQCLSGARLMDNGYAVLDFAARSDSQGRTYQLELLLTASAPGDCLGVYTAFDHEDGSAEGLQCDFDLIVPSTVRGARPEALSVFFPHFALIYGSTGHTEVRHAFESRDLPQYPLELRPGTVVSAGFSPVRDGDAALELIFGTHGRTALCDVTFELFRVTEDGDRKLMQREIAGSEIANNAALLIDLTEARLAAGALYEFRVRSHSEREGDCPAIWGAGVPHGTGLSSMRWERGARNLLDSAPKLQLSDEARWRPKRFDRELEQEGGLRGKQLLVLVPTSNQEAAAPVEVLGLFTGLGATIAVERRCSEAILKLAESSVVLLVDTAIDEELRRFIRAARCCRVPVVYLAQHDPREQPALRGDSAVQRRPDEEQEARRKLSEQTQLATSADLVIATNSAARSWAEECGVRALFLTEGTEHFGQSLARTMTQYRRRVAPTFTIISVLYAKQREIPYFLQALSRQDYNEELEVILVDDCSPDESVAAVQDWIAQAQKRGEQVPQVRIMRNTENIGNCGSRNLALSEARGDIAVVVDADCLLNRRFLSSHARQYQSGDCDVVIGPLNLESGPGDPLLALRSFEAHPERVMAEADLQDRVNQPSFLNCITRNFSIRTQLAGQGLFDPEFAYSRNPGSGYGWEDVEMGYRLYKAGHRIKFTSEAFSVHVSHPSVSPEDTKPQRSLLNFRRLLVKHPELACIARRWVLETYGKIIRWGEHFGLPVNEDRRLLDHMFDRFPKRLWQPPQARPLRVLTFRWHCPHQYELYKLPYQFTLVTGAGTGWTDNWEYSQRPLRDNARFAEFDKIRPEDFDLALLHFDENSLAPFNSNGILGSEWGTTFRRMLELVRGRIPAVAVCHGTPQFYGQYEKEADGERLGQNVEIERLRLVDALREIPVVVNSYQAQSEWRFSSSRVIWQGFDPTEYQEAHYRKGVLTLGSAIADRPHYRGYALARQVAERLEPQYRGSALKVREPDVEYPRGSNAYAAARYRAYVDAIREYSIYFNPTIRSPMPRSRGEAMMCGLVTVSANNHDAELFIKNGWNGFYSNSADELAEYLRFLQTNPGELRRIGARSRQTAADLFNHDRFLHSWQELVRSLCG